jgi:large subunit ribosomal protein L35
MPAKKYKMKTNSSVKKRFKLTASGKVKRKRAYLRHSLTHKTTKVKRKLRRASYVAKTQEHQIKAMIPYGLP